MDVLLGLQHRNSASYCVTMTRLLWGVAKLTRVETERREHVDELAELGTALDAARSQAASLQQELAHARQQHSDAMTMSEHRLQACGAAAGHDWRCLELRCHWLLPTCSSSPAACSNRVWCDSKHIILQDGGSAANRSESHCWVVTMIRLQIECGKHSALSA